MASSRLEKVGTIFTRTTGLIKSGALKWEERPLWYDIYEAFPPKEEPRFDRPVPNLKIGQIFYPEDQTRALFHNNNKHIGSTNLLNYKSKSLTQRFIEQYNKLEQQYQGKEASSEQIYKEAIDLLKHEREAKLKQPSGEEAAEEDVSLSNAFKQAQSLLVKQEEAPKIMIKDLFKD